MPARSRRSPRISAALLALLCAPAQADPLDVLVRAYPQALAGRDGNALVFRDGTRLDAGADEPAKPFARLLRDATVRDQFRLAYPAFAAIAPPAPDADPGRFRNQDFFDKLYGDCTRAKPKLEAVSWPGGGTVVFAAAQGAAGHLRAVAQEIAQLPPALRRAAFPSAGTYNCRTVKDTGRRSMHAYGAAIDLNLKFSDYWLWEKGGWRNRMPRAIVDAFERHGFVWGGRWHHYDTMHFEYRPELLAAAQGTR